MDARNDEALAELHSAPESKRVEVASFWVAYFGAQVAVHELIADRCAIAWSHVGELDAARAMLRAKEYEQAWRDRLTAIRAARKVSP
jgi:hypothetical protein